MLPQDFRVYFFSRLVDVHSRGLQQSVANLQKKKANEYMAVGAQRAMCEATMYRKILK